MPSEYLVTLRHRCYTCLLTITLDLTCKRGPVGHSEGLLIPRSSVRFHSNTENSNSYRFEVHRPSIKGTELLLKVIKAIIIMTITMQRTPGILIVYVNGARCGDCSQGTYCRLVTMR